MTSPRLIVITGGPGAGKTTILDVLRQHLGPQVAVVPEAASLLYRSGFPRKDTFLARRAAQRAIFRVQSEMERIALSESPLVLCDRGTLDGLAYWPGDPEEFWREVGSSREAELARYHAVLHLHVPSLSQGYSHHNPLRIESSEEAAALDELIAKAWIGHPRRHMVEVAPTFMDKVLRVEEVVGRELQD